MRDATSNNVVILGMDLENGEQAVRKLPQRSHNDSEEGSKDSTTQRTEKQMGSVDVDKYDS